MPDDKIELLRHTLVVIAYRARKTFRDAPEDFGNFHSSPSTRTPLQVLAHMGDLFDWTHGLIEGRHAWREATPLGWDDEIERFFAGLERLDAALAARLELAAPAERILQGPLADALTHIGQLAMLRREAGAPIRGENYFAAEMSAEGLTALKARATTSPRP